MTAVIVIAYDVDGTLWTSNGPITEERFLQLNENNLSFIVSPSPAGEGIPVLHVSGPDRLTNLLRVKTISGPADLYLYISDNKDYQIAKDAGFTYIEAAQFV